MPGHGKGKCGMKGMGQQYDSGYCMSTGTEKAENDSTPADVLRGDSHGGIPHGGGQGYCYGGGGQFRKSGIHYITEAESLKKQRDLDTTQRSGHTSLGRFRYGQR
ncbi:MAG: hypothetical protein HQK89_16810 [Nitrospirae bacterium]|nr:hypothetical protein [Nitrospirota bacterium]